MKNSRIFPIEALRKPLLDLRRRKKTSVDLNLDRIIASYLDATTDATPEVLQIGANDGSSNDPIRKWVRSDRFRTLLVEPQPDAFERLHNLYTGKEHVRLVQAAILDIDTTIPLYRIRPDKRGLYRSVYKRRANPTGISSLDKEHVKRFLLKVAPDYFRSHDAEAWIDSIPVKAMTIDTLAKQHNLSKLDILQCDVEGFDHVVVNAVLDSTMVHSPKIVIFEHKNLDGPEYSRLVDRLVAERYSLVQFGGDTCAFRGLRIF